jgi:hypothetical protein
MAQHGPMRASVHDARAALARPPREACSTAPRPAHLTWCMGGGAEVRAALGCATSHLLHACCSTLEQLSVRRLLSRPAAATALACCNSSRCGGSSHVQHPCCSLVEEVLAHHLFASPQAPPLASPPAPRCEQVRGKRQEAKEDGLCTGRLRH